MQKSLLRSKKSQHPKSKKNNTRGPWKERGGKSKRLEAQKDHEIQAPKPTNEKKENKINPDQKMEEEPA